MGPCLPPPLPDNKTGSLDRKSTRLNSSHVRISYAVFCLKKKKKNLRRCLFIKNQNCLKVPITFNHLYFLELYSVYTLCTLAIECYLSNTANQRFTFYVHI